MNNPFTKVVFPMAFLWFLALSPGLSAPLFPMPLFAAGATEMNDNRPKDNGSIAQLERVSPVGLAYHRLKTVLTNHSNPKTVAFVFPAVSEALSNPLSLPAVAQRVTDQTGDWATTRRFETGQVKPEEILRELVSKALEVFPLKPGPVDRVESSLFEGEKVPTLACVADQMTDLIAAAGLHVKTAFSSISPEENARLLKFFPRAMDDFLSRDNLSNRDAATLVAAAEKIHIEHLLRGFSVLSTLCSDDFLNTIRRTASNAPEVVLDREKYWGLKGRFLMIRETPAGLMLIGDRGPNVYGMDAALIVDLGGDDLYLNNAGAPVYEIQNSAVSEIRHPASVVIDFQGDDRYLNPGTGVIGTGFFGLGLILDVAGNDFYAGGQLSLGASFFGVGCLMDMAGNDTYSSSEGGQGCGFFGAAALFDQDGNDLYEGAKYAQGVGGAWGLGLLYDLKGNDHYRAGWKHGSSYGTKGIYQAHSQGVGWGFRKHAAGGIGVLLDYDGDDIYEAGNFSQGTGYFLGLGVLRDNAGNDVYRGNRYCQGSAAHQAAGALLDFAGDDAYSGKIAANQGAAWDLSVACLVDYAGNDAYTAGDLSLGAGAQNAIGLFFDGNGNDRYESPARSLGFSGGLSYGDGRGAGNMGIFLDVGGGKDFFTVKGRKNDTFLVDGNLGIFLDE